MDMRWSGKQYRRSRHGKNTRPSFYTAEAAKRDIVRVLKISDDDLVEDEHDDDHWIFKLK